MTDLTRFMSNEERGVASESEFKTPEQGAATSVWCATSNQLDGKGGVYCLDVDIARVITKDAQNGLADVLTGVLPWAIDPDLAERLWDISEKMTCIKYNF